MERVTLTIDGMSCSHCVGAVTRALEQLEGVRVDEVKIGSASVSYDPTATSTARIAQAIEAEGYTVAGSR